MNVDRTAALVVLFNPDYANIRELIEVLKEEVEVIYIVNNGTIDESYAAQKSALSNTGIRYLEMNGNLGIGAALNRGVKEIHCSGYRYCWFFDQDSLPEKGVLKRLLGNFVSSERFQNRVAAVSPLIVDQNGSGYLPMLVETGINQVCEKQIDVKQTVMASITSGMLVDTEAWHSVNGANEDYFLDFVDTDWCFRVRENGYQIIFDPSTQIQHKLGNVSSRSVKFAGRTIRQRPPIRTYFYIRNGLLMVNKSYSPSNWLSYVGLKIVKISLSGVIFGPARTEQMRAIIQALKYFIKSHRKYR